MKRHLLATTSIATLSSLIATGMLPAATAHARIADAASVAKLQSHTFSATFGGGYSIGANGHVTNANGELVGIMSGSGVFVDRSGRPLPAEYQKALTQILASPDARRTAAAGTTQRRGVTYSVDNGRLLLNRVGEPQEDERNITVGALPSVPALAALPGRVSAPVTTYSNGYTVTAGGHVTDPNGAVVGIRTSGGTFVDYENQPLPTEHQRALTRILATPDAGPAIVTAAAPTPVAPVYTAPSTPAVTAPVYTAPHTPVSAAPVAPVLVAPTASVILGPLAPWDDPATKDAWWAKDGRQKHEWLNARYAEESAKLDPNDPHYAAKSATLFESYRGGAVPTLMFYDNTRPGYLMTEAQAKKSAEDNGDDFALWQPSTFMTASGPQQFWIRYMAIPDSSSGHDSYGMYGGIGNIFEPSFYSSPFAAHNERFDTMFADMHAAMDREEAAAAGAAGNPPPPSDNTSEQASDSDDSDENNDPGIAGPGLTIDPNSTQWGLLPSQQDPIVLDPSEYAASVRPLTSEEHIAMLNESLANQSFLYTSGTTFFAPSDGAQEPPASATAIEGSVASAAGNAGITQPSVAGSGLRIGPTVAGWGLRQGQRLEENLLLSWNNWLKTADTLANNSSRFMNGTLSGAEGINLVFNYAADRLSNPLNNGDSFVWEGIPDIIRNVAARGGSGSTNAIDLIRNQGTTIGYQFTNPQRTSGVVVTVGEHKGHGKVGIEWRTKLEPD